MKVFKIFTVLSLVLLSVSLSSCLGGDNEYQGQATGTDFVTVSTLSATDASFSLANQNGGTISLYTSQGAKIDAAQYPVGSRAFITYTYQVGQDITKPVKIDLMSIAPVTIVPLQNVLTLPDFSYPRLTTNRIYYLAGYVNLILTVQKADSRTWSCYLDVNNSRSDVAEVYLNTTETNPGAETIGVALSVDVRSLTSGNNYKTINFHISDQNGTDKTYPLSMTSMSSY